MLKLDDRRLDGVYSSNDNLKLAGKSKEYYVLAILKHFFLGKDSSMVKKERPDLWDEIQSHGVEVTEAVFSSDAAINSSFRKMHSPKDDKSEQKFADRIIENGGEFVHAGNAVNYPYHNEDAWIDCVHNAIANKTKKLSDYRKRFPVMGLAVILDYDTSYRGFDVKLQRLIYSFSDDEDDFYDEVYIVYWSRVIHFDCKKHKAKCISIRNDDKKRFQNLARMTVEGKISQDDPIWRSY